MTTDQIRIFLSSSIEQPSIVTVRDVLKSEIGANTPYELVYADLTSGSHARGAETISLERLARCDLVVVLIDRVAGEVTMAEWREAIRRGRPRLVFFSDETTQEEKTDLFNRAHRGATGSPGMLETYSSVTMNEAGAVRIAWNIDRSVQDEIGRTQNADHASDFASEIHTYFDAVGRSPGPIRREQNGWYYFDAVTDEGQTELIACQAEPVVVRAMARIAETARRDYGGRFRIVSGSGASDRLRIEAEAQGGRIQAVVDLVFELTEAEPLLRAVETEFEREALQNRYIELHCDKQCLDPQGREIGTDPRGELDDYFSDWLRAPARAQMAVLGDFGSGKSWFCLNAAHSMIVKLLSGQTTRLPILVRFKDVAAALSARAAEEERGLAAAIRDGELDLIDYLAERLDVAGHSRTLVETLIASGRLLIILDGYDEIAGALDKAARDHVLAAVRRLNIGHSKTLLTSRRALFADAGSESEELFGDAGGDFSVRFEIVYLSAMDPDQIEAKAAKRFGPKAGEYLERLRAHPKLAEFVSRPIVLDMVFGVLMEVKKDTELTLSKVYDICTRRWLEHAARPGSKMSPDSRFDLMQRLAWALYSARDGDIASSSRLPASELSLLVEDLVHEIDENFDLSVDSSVRSELLLVRDGEGVFDFAHRSFMEFLVAREMIEALRSNRPERLAEVTISEPVLEFMREEVFEDEALERGLKSPLVRQNNWLAGNLLSVMNATGRNLSGRDFSGMTIRHPNLVGADLRQADFSGAILDSAQLGGADLSGADMRGSELISLMLGVKSSAKTVVCSPTDDLVAATNSKHEVILFSPAGDVPPRIIARHDDSITRLDFSPDGRWLGSVAFDRQLMVHDVETGERVVCVRLEENTTYGLSLGLAAGAPDGHGVILTGGNDYKVRAWTIDGGKEGPAFGTHAKSIYDIAAYAELGLVAVASFDGAISVHSVSDRREGFRIESATRFDGLKDAEGRQDLLNGVAIDPAGEILACCDNSGRILVRRKLSDRFATRPKVVQAHAMQVWSIDFSADSAFAATSSTDRTVRIWNCEDWSLAAELIGHEGAVWDVAFDRTGRYVASSSNDSTVRVWDWRREEERRRERVGAPEDKGLNCSGMRIDGARRISPLQLEVLRDLGAIGEAEPYAGEAG